MTNNGSETDSGMVRNSSDSLGMNFKSILSPELSRKAYPRIYAPKNIPYQSVKRFESRSMQIV